MDCDKTSSYGRNVETEHDVSLLKADSVLSQCFTSLRRPRLLGTKNHASDTGAFLTEVW